MASRKCNETRGHRGHAAGAGAAGGIGGVAPDVNLSRPTYPAHCGPASPGRPGAVAAALPPSPCPVAAVDLAQPEPRGAASDNALPALAPDKPVLCGQPPRGDYLAHGGKSFRPIMSMQKCTSYEVIDHPNAAVGPPPASLATTHQGDFRCEDAR